MAGKTTNLQLQKIDDTDYAGNFPTIYNNNLDLIDGLKGDSYTRVKINSLSELLNAIQNIKDGDKLIGDLMDSRNPSSSNKTYKGILDFEFVITNAYKTTPSTLLSHYVCANFKKGVTTNTSNDPPYSAVGTYPYGVFHSMVLLGISGSDFYIGKSFMIDVKDGEVTVVVKGSVPSYVGIMSGHEHRFVNVYWLKHN